VPHRPSLDERRVRSWRWRHESVSVEEVRSFYYHVLLRQKLSNGRNAAAEPDSPHFLNDSIDAFSRRVDTGTKACLIREVFNRGRHFGEKASACPNVGATATSAVVDLGEPGDPGKHMQSRLPHP